MGSVLCLAKRHSGALLIIFIITTFGDHGVGSCDPQINQRNRPHDSEVNHSVPDYHTILHPKYSFSYLAMPIFCYSKNYSTFLLLYISTDS